MYVCSYGIVNYYLQKYAKDIKKKHKKNRYKLRKNSTRWINFFNDIRKYFIQGKIGIFQCIYYCSDEINVQLFRD